MINPGAALPPFLFDLMHKRGTKNSMTKAPND